MKKIGILIIGLIAISACVSSHFIAEDSAIYKPKPSDYKVEVYFAEEKPEQPYKIIGLIYADQPWGLLSGLQKNATERIKDEARKRGADAVMDLKVVSLRAWGAPRVQAMAIIFEK